MSSSALLDDDLSFIALAATFFVGLALNADPVRTIFKGLPIALLVVRVLVARRAQARLVAAGLFFGLLGDVCLELERLHGARLHFELGIAAFLLGHAIYIAAILRAEHAFLRGATAALVARAFLPVWLAALALFAAIWQWGHIEAALVVPVLVYALTIMTMLGAALLLRDARTTLGALLFVASDLLLAVDRFVLPLPQATLLIMLTYYGAQYFIATAFVRRR